MKRLLEVIIVTGLLIAVTKFLYGIQGDSFIGRYYSTIFAMLFLYVPMMVMWWKKDTVDFVDGGFRDLSRGLLAFVLVVVIIFPPFLVGAHFWETLVYGKQGFRFTPFPDFFKVAIFQVLIIALPEEFYFRGYMQGVLNRIFARRWKIFGVHLGFAWILTAVIFAFSHSLIQYQWWHFSIFFPALVFGWLRERTGSITASILFHATSNMVSDWIARSYY